MTFSKQLFLGFAVLSLAACQTTSGVTSANDVLLSDISTPEISQAGTTRLMASNSPTCLKFYENTAMYVAMPSADLNAPTGPSFGDKVLKTVVLGTLSGLVGGGVSALGIESGFVEAALIGTAGQVTYQLGDTVYDDIVGTGDNQPVVPPLTPMEEIQKAAALLGCPAPDQASIAALNLSGKTK